MYTRCAYHNCGNKSYDIAMFRFPVKDPDRLILWIRNSGNVRLDLLTTKELRNRYVCAAHFPVSRIHEGEMRTRLIGPAVPVHFGSVEENTKSAAATNNSDVSDVSSPEVLKVRIPSRVYVKPSKTSGPEKVNTSSSTSQNSAPIENAAQECGYQCSVCGKWYATEYLVREHARQHVSYYACSLCDMSAPTRAAIAVHMRYRHMDADAVKNYACTHCDYKAVIKFDLEKHIRTHDKKRKKQRAEHSSDESTDEDVNPAKKVKKEIKKYACHLCPSKEAKIFTRGHRLTTHLVHVHGAQWPFGHSRFRYQISEDGIYRLTTTRIEDLEVSKKIVGGNSIPKESLKPKYDFNLKRVKEATKHSPVQFEISLKGGENIKDDVRNVPPIKIVKVETVKGQEDENTDTMEATNNIKGEIIHEYDDGLYNANELVEICTYDVDESGNIISSETTIQAKNEILNVKSVDG